METPDGIAGSVLTGPFPVGTYAAALRDRLRGFTRVQVFGEVFGFKAGRAKVWFELRDAAGALPCSMWREDFDKLRLGPLADGAQVVVAGGCDYYPGSRTASPGFSFSVARLRVAGEGDLLAQLEQLRRRLHAEGLFEPQKALARPVLPRCIGVVTGESGKARDDVLAGLRRRGWAGRLVWGFAPVQDRHAAPAIRRALTDLASCPEVEVIVVARGGGSLADLFAFCDETLCRTVALLRVPVISSVGHHTDRTLWTTSPPWPARRRRTPPRPRCPSTAAWRERRWLRARCGSSASAGARSSTARGCWRGSRARRPITSSATARGCTRPCASCAPRRGGRSSRASEAIARMPSRSRAARSPPRPASERAASRVGANASALERTSAAALERRRRDLDRILGTLAAHDPQRTLERGYALLEDPAGEPVTSAEAAAR